MGQLFKPDREWVDYFSRKTASSVGCSCPTCRQAFQEVGAFRFQLWPCQRIGVSFLSGGTLFETGIDKMLVPARA
jgi:hypothetical protein